MSSSDQELVKRNNFLPKESFQSWNMPAFLVLPSIRKRLPGRPRVNRRKDADENVQGNNAKSCTICGGFGHNRRGCQQQGDIGRGRHTPKRGGRPRTKPLFPSPPIPSPTISTSRVAPSSNVARGKGRGSGCGAAGTRGSGRGATSRRGIGRGVAGGKESGRDATSGRGSVRVFKKRKLDASSTQASSATPQT